MFGHRKKEKEGMFDPSKQKAVIVQSICTGEQSLCFVDKETGKKEQVGCVRTEADLDAYVKEYHLDKAAIGREF